MKYLIHTKKKFQCQYIQIEHLRTVIYYQNLLFNKYFIFQTFIIISKIQLKDIRQAITT